MRLLDAPLNVFKHVCDCMAEFSYTKMDIRLHDGRESEGEGLRCPVCKKIISEDELGFIRMPKDDIRISNISGLSGVLSHAEEIMSAQRRGMGMGMVEILCARYRVDLESALFYFNKFKPLGWDGSRFTDWVGCVKRDPYYEEIINRYPELRVD